MLNQAITQPKAIFILGPTCSGKTAVSLSLARQWPMEIISVDSALVYRGMDVGTAKPSVEERAGIRHHLIDIRDPGQAYSVAEFVEDASHLIDEISARGKMPLLVGGTMLYAKALLGGLAKLPPANPELRDRISEIAAQSGWAAVHQHLQQVDPASAARLHPNDSQRLQRALEVCWQTGKPFSSFLNAELGMGQQLDFGQEEKTSHRPLIFGLMPQDRAWLHEKIAVRFEAMLESGFLEEARALFDRGDLDESLPAMRCVGYRQVWQYFSGQVGYDAFVEKALAATRQLAKRQLTWLRRWPGLTRVDCDVRICDLEVLVHQEAARFLGQE